MNEAGKIARVRNRISKTVAVILFGAWSCAAADPYFEPAIVETICPDLVEGEHVSNAQMLLDGRWLLVSRERMVSRQRLRKHKPDGGIDPNFQPSVWEARLVQIKELWDGKLAVLAQDWDLSKTIVRRLKANGSIDPEFAPSEWNWARQADSGLYGSLYVQGRRDGETSETIYRLRNDGSFDNAFISPRSFFAIRSFANTEDGETYILATTAETVPYRLFRLKYDGSVDQTFQHGGSAYDFEVINREVFVLSQTAEDIRFHFYTRLLRDGSVDPLFRTMPVGSPSIGFYTLRRPARDGAGFRYVMQWTENGSHINRFLPNGELDATFRSVTVDDFPGVFNDQWGVRDGKFLLTTSISPSNPDRAEMNWTSIDCGRLAPVDDVSRYNVAIVQLGLNVPAQRIFPRLPASPWTTNALSMGETSIGVYVKRTGNHEQAQTIRFATREGTALEGIDYFAASGMTTFPAGLSEAFVRIRPIDDQEPEFNEFFWLDFSLTDGTPLNSLPVMMVNNDRGLPLRLRHVDQNGRWRLPVVARAGAIPRVRASHDLINWTDHPAPVVDGVAFVDIEPTADQQFFIVETDGTDGIPLHWPSWLAQPQ